MNKINLDLHKDLDKTKYIIIPIGINCKVGLFLRNCGIKCFTYPYDWASNTTIDEILDLLNDHNNFNINNWFRLNNLPQYLPHDKINDLHGEEENIFLNIDLITKYKRRFERLFLDIKKENVILFRYYTNYNDNISLIQKEKFRLINNSISFIEINNFTQDEIESDSMYKNYLLSLFIPNLCTLIVNEIINSVNNLKFPITYYNFYDNIINIVKKYNINNIFPDDSDILFNTRNEIIAFIGNCLSKKYKDIELFG